MRCDIKMTKAPSTLSASVGDSATINLKANQSISHYLARYQRKLGEAPKLLMHSASRLHFEIPSRVRDRKRAQISLSASAACSLNISSFVTVNNITAFSTMIQIIT